MCIYASFLCVQCVEEKNVLFILYNLPGIVLFLWASLPMGCEELGTLQPPIFARSYCQHFTPIKIKTDGSGGTER